MRHASEECWYVVCVKCGEIEIKIGRDVPVRSHEGWFQFDFTCSCQETRAASARTAESGAASVTEGWTSVPSTCRDVVDVDGGEDAVGSGFSAEGGAVGGEDDDVGGGEVDSSLFSSREEDWKSTAAASAELVTGVSMIVTRLREIAVAGADVVGGDGGEDAVGDGPGVVDGDLVGEEGVRRRTQAS